LQIANNEDSNRTAIGGQRIIYGGKSAKIWWVWGSRVYFIIKPQMKCHL
jgi:hypothetical protein